MLERALSEAEPAPLAYPAIEPLALRRLLGHFASGVAIVAASTPSHGLIGMTVSSFNTVSLDPPLVLFSVARSAFGLDPLLRARLFSVNLLARGQTALSNRFACAGADKWTDTDFVCTVHGAPVLMDALATFECGHYARYDGGDHVIVVGRIAAMNAAEASAEPLLFYRGRYHAIGEPV